MFKVGDKIVYPMHGAGIIEDIEEKEILGEKRQYYVLKIPIGNMKVMIPVGRSVDIGVRTIVDDATLDAVIEVLKGKMSDMEDNWNRRFRENMDKIKTGNIFEVAEVVRDLILLDKKKGLSTGERKMLNNAKQILVSEFSLVRDMDREVAEEMIYQYIVE